jgi:hypothetical protein
VTGGGITRTVTVVQAAAYYLTVDPASRSVANSAGSTTFSIASNTNWSVTDNADWLTVTPANSSNNGTITSTYTANPVTSIRTATITIVGGGFTRTVTVVQAAAYFLTITPENQAVVRVAGSTMFSIASNISWNVTVSVEWLSVSPMSGSNNATLSALFSANPVTEPRSATITVTGSGLTRQVTVVQDAADYLMVDPASRSVANFTGSTTYSVTANIKWRATPDVDWVTLIPAASDGDNTLHASYTANSATSTRTAIISITGAGITRTVRLEQAGTPTQLTVSTSALSFAYGAGTSSFAIGSNTSWSVSDDASWLTTSPSSGANNANVTVTVAANSSTSARIGTITISGGELTRTITVTQSAAPTALMVSSTTLAFGSGSGSTSLSVSANVSWSVSDDAAWITLSPISGSGDATVTVSVTANPLASSRTGYMTISGGGITRTVSITQSGEAATLSVTPGSLSFGSDSSSNSITVNSNVSWSASEDASWIFVSPGNGTANSIVTISVSANRSITPRSGTVTISGGGLTRMLAISQAEGAPALEVSPTLLSFASASSNAKFQITSNVSWTASANVLWITLSRTSGPNDVQVTVTVSANLSTTSRTGVITVTGGGLTRTVEIVQSGAGAAMTLSTANLSFGPGAGSLSFGITTNVSWAATANVPWISMLPAFGPNDATVLVTAAVNTSTNDRSGIITVTGGGLIRTVEVTQSGAAPILSVWPESLLFSSAAAEASFSVSTNVLWGASNDVPWIVVNPISGTRDTTVTVTVQENLSTISRNGTVSVSGKGITRTVAISQSGAAAILTVSPSSLSFGFSSASASFSVRANVSWTASDTLSWVVVSPVSGSQDTTVTVTVAANPSITPRSGTLTVTGGGLSRIVLVSQAGADALLAVSPPLLSLGADSSTAPLTILANMPWSATRDAPWITLTPTSGVMNATMTIAAAANQTATPRNAAVTVAGGGLTRTVAVTQSGSPFLGSIRIITNLEQATFRLIGPIEKTGGGMESTFANVPVGSYTIRYGEVTNYAAPDDEERTLSGGDTLTFSGTYTLTTRDAWEEVANLAIGSIFPMTVNGQGHIFVGSERSGILRSTDHGGSWTPINHGLTDLNITSLILNSSGHLFAGSVMNGTFRSTDNGESWTIIHHELSALNNSALAINSAGQIFSSTWNGAMFRSSDNGQSWTVIDNGLVSSNISALTVSQRGYIFAGTWSNGIFRSADNGGKWIAVNNGFKALARILTIAVDTRGDVFVGTMDDGAFRSTDDGSTWMPITDGLSAVTVRAFLLDSTGNIFAGTNAGIFHSKDRGASWTPENAGLSDPDITSMAMDGQGYILLGTKKSEFWRSFQPVTPVELKSEPISLRFGLGQNYPNPFNPSTVLEFSTEHPAWTSIRIYNILGQQVKTLFDAQVGGGLHRVVWDSSNDSGIACPAGVYICIMKSGGRLDSKKILLIR